MNEAFVGWALVATLPAPSPGTVADFIPRAL
jgi:hypothetical protein